MLPTSCGSPVSSRYLRIKYAEHHVITNIRLGNREKYDFLLRSIHGSVENVKNVYLTAPDTIGTLTLGLLLFRKRNVIVILPFGVCISFFFLLFIIIIIIIITIIKESRSKLSKRAL